MKSSLLGLCVLWFVLGYAPIAKAAEFGVVVYGATPGGLAAAIGAAKSGQDVLLVEPTERIGGMLTSGLSHSDFHSLESLSGTFLDFCRRVEAHYIAEYGADSAEVRDCFHGTFGEPKLNLAICEAMLAEQPRITVLKGHRLTKVAMSGAAPRRRISSATFAGSDGSELTANARVFIDATYEGDLLALAGVPWRAGREGRDEYGEPLAPAEADGQLQAYNFRFIMTRNAANRVTPVAPAGYRREDFVAVLPVLESGQITKVFDYPRGCIFKAHTPPLAGGKYDINDVSSGIIRLSLPGKNLGWPEAGAAERAKIFAEHLRDQAGLLYFLQNDEAVPTRFRDEAREWGWCRDEFTETSHLPPQLYVREARRMLGAHVFTQRDSEHAPGDARAILQRDAIAMGDYGNNCHGTAHEGDRFGGRHSGEFYNPVPPYQIPYGVLLPREGDNLLVPVAASSSHVGFCALRLEPIWTSLGQAAGHAAALAIERDIAVQKVDVPALQRRLHAAGSATIYVSDVLPGSPDFAAVQWWGTLGGLHGLEPMPTKPGQRGAKLHGQYYQANPGHQAKLGEVLTEELAARWQKLAKEQGLSTESLPAADGATTRGAWIVAAYKLAEVPDAER
jgi:hypothetical protein